MSNKYSAILFLDRETTNEAMAEIILGSLKSWLDNGMKGAVSLPIDSALCVFRRDDIPFLVTPLAEFAGDDEQEGDKEQEDIVPSCKTCIRRASADGECRVNVPVSVCSEYARNDRAKRPYCIVYNNVC